MFLLSTRSQQQNFLLEILNRDWAGSSKIVLNAFCSFYNKKSYQFNVQTGKKRCQIIQMNFTITIFGPQHRKGNTTVSEPPAS